MHATEDIRYPAAVHHYAQIDYLSALLKLYGFQVTEPKQARVVEIGCAYGTNLMAMAERFPEASFVGIDIDPVAIQEAELVVELLGLSNIEFIVSGDLANVVKGREFDYVIAHGVFSWVLDDVKESILQLCQDSLSEDGIAYISYNCNPGWLYPSALRELLLEGTLQSKGDERLRNYRERLTLLQNAMAETGESGPMAQTKKWQKSEVQWLQDKSDGLLVSEMMGECNDPFYVAEFCQWIDSFQLEYLGDANPRFQIRLDEPLAVKSLIDEYDGNAIMQHQMQDFLENRRYRTSLLRKKVSPSYRFKKDVIQDLHYKLPASVESYLSLKDHLSITLHDGYKVNAPLYADAFFRLFQSKTVVSPRELYLSLGADEQKSLIHLLFTLVKSYFLIPTTATDQWSEVDALYPMISMMNRVCAVRYGFVYDVNRRMHHPEELECLDYMEGKNSVEEIAQKSKLPVASIQQVVSLLNSHRIC